MSRQNFLRLFVTLAFSVWASAASGDGLQDLSDIEDKALRTKVEGALHAAQHLAFNPTIIRAIRDQNAAGLSLSEIKKRDEHWKNAPDNDSFKRALQSNQAGRLLARLVQSKNPYTELFVTDNKGANVAAYPPTSDYWQGDEEKFSEVFGPGKPLLMDPRVDESTGAYSAQVSVPVRDGQKIIGVLVVGVSLEGMKAKS